MKGSDFVDIISEILETDRLAEDKLAQAEKRKTDILADCEKQIEKIREEAKKSAQAYKVQRAVEVKEDTAGKTAVLKAEEENKIREFEQLYEKNHETWESEILKSVLNQN
jgi:hypothetical protein